MKENEIESESSFEKIIIRVLFSSEQIRDKVIPYLESDLFSDDLHQQIIKEIISFNANHNTFPRPADLMLNIQNETVKQRLRDIGKITPSSYHEENLLQKIEQFFKKQLVWNELVKSVELIKEGKLDEIDPQKIIDAKSFSFDTSIGIDLLEDDGDKFFDDIHDEGIFVSTGLKQFDKMMNGGFKKKTFSMIIAGTNCFDGDEEIEIIVTDEVLRKMKLSL